MNRAYRSWTRDACLARQREIDDEKRSLQISIDQLERQEEALQDSHSVEA